MAHVRHWRQEVSQRRTHGTYPRKISCGGFFCGDRCTYCEKIPAPVRERGKLGISIQLLYIIRRFLKRILPTSWIIPLSFAGILRGAWRTNFAIAERTKCATYGSKVCAIAKRTNCATYDSKLCALDYRTKRLLLSHTRAMAIARYVPYDSKLCLSPVAPCEYWREHTAVIAVGNSAVHYLTPERGEVRRLLLHHPHAGTGILRDDFRNVQSVV